jgi:hypothetical protein
VYRSVSGTQASSTLIGKMLFICPVDFVYPCTTTDVNIPAVEPNTRVPSATIDHSWGQV